MPAFDYKFHRSCHCRPDVKHRNDEGQTPCREYYQGIPGMYIVNKGVPVEYLTHELIKELQSEVVK